MRDPKTNSVHVAERTFKTCSHNKIITCRHETLAASPSLDFRVTDSPVVKLELVCQNEEAQSAIDIILENAKTTEPGDGIIYLSDIEDAFQIKTGESIKRYDP